MDNEITIKLDDDGRLLTAVSKGKFKLKLEDDPWKYNSIEKFEGVVEKPWPQKGDDFYFIDIYGYSKRDKFNDLSHNILLKIGNFFQTKEEAQMYSLRLESLSKGFIPQENDEESQWFWVIDFEIGRPVNTCHNKSHLITPKFPTKEECQEWYDKYGASWLALLNDKK